ncbi:MAG TPA: hypothetical protein VHF01_01880 [Candidatus Acidoferrum sp.]|nr:hypothetical protein [Candidatus Acidoferrum sp.]
MKRTRYCFRKPQVLISWVFLILSISILRLAMAQAVPYAGTFAKSEEEVDKALKEMQAYAGQKLPIVDGFVATGDQPLKRYERAFYQFSIDLLPAASGGTIVRVTAKITAWYADPDPSKSGYQVMPSNGRLELDLLDRLREKFGRKLTASTARSDVQAPKPKLDLSTGLPGSSLPSSRSSVPAAAGSSGTTSGVPGDDEVAALRIKREAEEKRMQQLNGELQSLREIQRNQAHPLNLVVVKKNGTPVLARPAAGSHPLFVAAADDEFEFLDAEGEWIHVQISGASRGYIRRSSLDLPEFIAARLKSPNGNAANEKLDAFRIEREENSSFPGDWEPLKGKTVKIYTVQPISQDPKETDARAKLAFAGGLLRKYAAETTASSPALDGIVVIFDAADGGIVGSTLLNVQQLASGSLSQDNFWKHCYLDPPDAFRPAPNP